MLWVAGMCAIASAGSKTTIRFDQATTACKDPVTVAAEGDKDTFEVVLTDSTTPGAASVTAKAAITLRIQNGAALVREGTIKEHGTALGEPVSITASGGETIVVGEPATTECNFVFAKPTAATVKTDNTQPPDNSGLSERALQFLRDHGITDHAKVGGPTGRTYRLYHLPDGTPAFPMPNGISEEDRIEPWVVAPAGQTATAEVTVCKDVPAVRISGTRPAIDPKVNSLKSGERTTPAPLTLRRISAPFQCAEDLSYKVHTDLGERDISFKIAPVYRFSWGLSYGFDFSRPTRLRAVERPVDDMGTTERVIIKDNDRSAFRPMATLTLNACNANLKDWDLCDAIGLTAMADLGRLTEGGGIGLKLQPYPGLGLLVGMTFFQVDTIAAGHDMKVGDVLPGSRELPIDKQFTGQSLGFFLGVGGDTDTVKALLSY
jgi:hypothetical protein